MNQNFSRKIDLFSFMFALFVVWGHTLYFAYTDYGYMKSIGKFVSNLVAMGMGYFFFMSGYLFCRNYKLQMTLTKWKKRVKSLLIPYVFWNTVAFLVLIVLRVIGFAKPWRWFLDINQLADGPLWYVLAIMIYMILTPLIYILIQRKLFWGLMVGGFACVDILISNSQTDRFWYYFPVYLLGCGVALHYRELFENIFADSKADSGSRREWMTGTAGFALVCIVCCALTYGECFIWYKIAKIAIRMISPFAVFWCFRKCQITKYQSIWKASFFVYCVHEIIDSILIQLRPVQILFERYWLVNSTPVGFTIYALIIVLISLLLYLLLKKFTPKFCAIICGGR